jgi:hypothetical protein
LPCTRNPKQRALRMTTSSAGVRVSAGVHLHVTAIESHPERLVIRINQGKGQKDRSTLLSTCLLQELRASWRLERPPPWFLPGHAPKRPMPSGTAGKSSERARQRAGLAHGRGMHTLRHCLAPHLLDAGVEPRTMQVLLGHGALKPTARYLHGSRQRLANSNSPFDLLCFPTAHRDAVAEEAGDRGGALWASGPHSPPPPPVSVGHRRYVSSLRRELAADAPGLSGTRPRDGRHHGLSHGVPRGARRAVSAVRLRTLCLQLVP